MKVKMRYGIHVLIMLMVILTAALGSSNLNANVYAYGANADSGFVITGYTTNLSNISKGQTVNVLLQLKHTEQKTPEDMTWENVDVSRLVDSFSGGEAKCEKILSKPGEPLKLTISVNQLVYTGSGRSLKLMISAGGAFEQLEVSITECEEYEKPVYDLSPSEPVTTPAPVAVMSRNEIKSALKAGEKQTITLYVKNAGSKPMKSPILTVAASDGLFLPGTGSTLQMKDIPAGRTESVTIDVQVLKEASSANQYLDLTLNFTYFNSVATVDGSSTGKVTIPVQIKKVEEEKPDTEKTPIDSPVPNLIISSFNYGGASVAAGSEFNLGFQFVNTSSKLPVENAVVTLEGGEGFTINGATNTFYFDKIKAGGTKSVSVPMKVLGNVENGAKPVTVSFKYEYVDNEKRIAVSSEMKLTVPVYQPDRFEITYPTVPAVVYAGEEISISMNYVNKSKSAISNVEAALEGNVETYTPVQNLGNMEAGKSGTMVFAVTPMEAGETEFTIKVTYEDGNGQSKTREFPITLNVEEMVMDDPGFYEEPIEEPEPKSTGNWKIAAAVAVAAVILVIFIIKKRKKAAAIKKEAEMWNNWDDSADISGTASTSSTAGDNQEMRK